MYYKRSFFKGFLKKFKNEVGNTLSSIELPSIEGLNLYKIKVSRNGIRLVHHAYNSDGFTWSTPPGNGEKHHIDLKEGTNTFDIFVSEHYGNKNKIELVNGRLLKVLKLLIKLIKLTIQKKH